MSTQPDPRSYSERELTLRAISTISQRARAVQRRVTATRDGQDPERPVERGDPSLTVDEDLHNLSLGDDNDLDDEAALPNPMITDAELRHYLEQATVHQGEGRTSWRGLIGLVLNPTRLQHQAHFNAMIVHALHQLDHRSRLQRLTLADLEAETAAVRRALSDLESRFHQPS